MEKETMVFYPHKVLRWFSVFLLLAMLILTVVLFVGSVDGGARTFMICILILAAFVLADTISLAKITVVLDRKRILIQNSLTKYSASMPWEALHYAYYVYSSKGHKYIFLSTKNLTSDMLKKNFLKSTRLLAQFKKGNNVEYICFSLENDYNNEVTKFIPSHIFIQKNNLREP